MMSAGLALYLLFVVSWFTHAAARLPWLGSIRFDLLLMAGLAALALLRAYGEPRSRAIPDAGKAILALCAYVVVTLPLVEWPGTVVRAGLPNLAKAVAFYFFTVAFVRTARDLRWFLAVFLACQFFRILEPVHLHVTSGYWGAAAFMDQGAEALERLSGAPHDVINPNGLAFVVCTVLPFALLLGRPSWSSWIVRLPVVAVAGYALALTGSRSGMIALLGVYLGWLAVSRRRAAVVVAGIAAAVALAAMMTDDLADRYLSIVGAGVRNEATAVGRIEGVVANLEVALGRPVFGHGLGTSREANFHYAGFGQLSHNLYAELAQELGIVGTLLFGWFMWSAVRSVGNGSGAAAGAAMPGVIESLRVWLAVLLLFSLASYGLSSYEWYLFAALGVVVARLRCADDADRAPDAVGSVPKALLYIDFEEGLLAAPHANGSARVAADALPAPGAIDFLRRTVREFDVVVHSPRCATQCGRQEVSRWLRAHGVPRDCVRLSSHRPGMHRATGCPRDAAGGGWPTMEQLLDGARGLNVVR